MTYPEQAAYLLRILGQFKGLKDPEFWALEASRLLRLWPTHCPYCWRGYRRDLRRARLMEGVLGVRAAERAAGGEE